MTPDPPDNALSRRIYGIWKWLSTPPQEPLDDSADWYAGLAVDSETFSKQLIQLQTSLRTHEARPRSVDSAPIEFRPESA
jgi:hypothetical protein